MVAISRVRTNKAFLWCRGHNAAVMCMLLPQFLIESKEVTESPNNYQVVLPERGYCCLQKKLITWLTFIVY